MAGVFGSQVENAAFCTQTAMNAAVEVRNQLAVTVQVQGVESPGDLFLCQLVHLQSSVLSLQSSIFIL